MRVKVSDMYGTVLTDLNFDEKFGCRVNISSSEGSSFFYVDNSMWTHPTIFRKTWWARKRERRLRNKFRKRVALDQEAIDKKNSILKEKLRQEDHQKFVDRTLDKIRERIEEKKRESTS